MSERILKALMQLFAIIAKVDFDESGEFNPKKNTKERSVVELFLKQELNPEQVKAYLNLFDEYIYLHHSSKKHKDGKQKRTSVNSVKILRICAQINSELTQKQRIIVLVRILEFICVKKTPTDQEVEFAETVADSFNIDKDEFESTLGFIYSDKHSFNIKDPNLLLISSSKPDTTFKHLQVEGIEGEIWVLRVNSVNFHFFKYFGKDEIYLNGQLIANDRHHILTQGSSIRSSRMQTVYYSDILNLYLSDENRERFVFRSNHVIYKFGREDFGIRDLSFEEENGRMIGIMGASGAGKSTLLNILNGNISPTKGHITINGIDIHREKEKIQGVIGFVSQDDLLIEELTVFQNLYFNAQLSFGELGKRAVARKVVSLLSVLGLYEAKDLKVGSPLEKTISGGQRKRLNIALELIREPSVLFVDEPTSGLSSRDSENIMDLLKELTLKGKLVFVVIHQPSSDIFKMFDSLLILDQGGYPIYNGNPVDAVIYFKEAINHVNSQESECRTCGNVNPEQIFNIIESKVVDEYGIQTNHRKTPPEEWNKLYKSNLIDQKQLIEDVPEIVPKSKFSIPNKVQQYKVFFKRDVLSKLTNRQYVLINLFEAPLLAAILSFFVKFFSGETYSFEQNNNIPQYIFIAVVIALFIGLTVAAEEIIKDRKIKKRETFLNLSKGSYLLSKITILFSISAIQAFLFVIVGNSILEIKDMWIEYWFVFFSLACFANITGLNISASFNSAKVIYILIPLVIIPQLLFSGVIVKFDKLHPLFGKDSGVPWIGNLMASRWAYEALAVVQFKENEFQIKSYELEKAKSAYEWKRDYWIPEVQLTVNRILDNIVDDNKDNIQLLNNELPHEFKRWTNIDGNEVITNLNSKDIITVKSTLVDVKSNLELIKEDYNMSLSAINKQLDSLVRSYNRKEYRETKNLYFNKALYDQVTNRNELDKLVIKNNRIIQKRDPIYLSSNAPFFSAHFFAPEKRVFGKVVPTFASNIIVLWLMTFTLIITLYFDVFKYMIEFWNRFRKKLKLSKNI